MSMTISRWQRLTLLVFIALGPIWVESVGAQSVADRIDDLLQQRQADRAFWGLCAYDLKGDSLLVSRNDRHSFLPASNQKLLTTAAALDVLGSTYRYETTLWFEGTTQDSVMTGDLHLEGSGDPTFGSPSLRGADPLEEWAERLADMGIRRVEGRLIGDDDAFDDWPYPDGWNVNYLTRQKGRNMGVSAGGLSYHDNVIPVRIEATEPGEPPEVGITPEGTVRIKNEAVTSERWRGSTLLIKRTFSTNELVLTGSVARSYQGVRSVPVSDPTAFTLRVFRKRLRDAGIETDLELVDIDSFDDEPDEGEPLFVELSPPLSEIVDVVNKESNNFYAEQLFRTYGWGGSYRGGARRTKTFLRRAGVNTQTLSIHDGSGLSRKNLLSPRAMVELLKHMDEHQEAEVFVSSLPEGGEWRTTLDYRLSGVPIRAKTGSLASVRALSGYVEGDEGREVAFSVFANNYSGPSYQITRTIDDIVRALTSPPS